MNKFIWLAVITLHYNIYYYIMLLTKTMFLVFVTNPYRKYYHYKAGFDIKYKHDSLLSK